MTRFPFCVVHNAEGLRVVVSYITVKETVGGEYHDYIGYPPNCLLPGNKGQLVVINLLSNFLMTAVSHIVKEFGGGEFIHLLFIYLLCNIYHLR